ncbi:hypothetical protein [Nonomuraea sp. NPDC049758]|uniref:hypothetical protein n=1 Tax=Nonomuraea sp. NPDC049758 TaxID=3154360 RepID=UPI003434CEC8
MPAEAILPDWAFPPPQGYVAEDLDHIPDLPPHTELIDGSLIVLGPQAPSDEALTCYQAEDVILAVEVVSPVTEVRDRKRKPTLYAEAGIPHDRLKLTVPFDIDIDLTTLNT